MSLYIVYDLAQGELPRRRHPPDPELVVAVVLHEYRLVRSPDLDRPERFPAVFERVDHDPGEEPVAEVLLHQIVEPEPQAVFVLPLGEFQVAVEPDDPPGIIDTDEEHPAVGVHEGRKGSRDGVLDVPGGNASRDENETNLLQYAVTMMT